MKMQYFIKTLQCYTFAALMFATTACTSDGVYEGNSSETLHMKNSSLIKDLANYNDSVLYTTTYSYAATRATAASIVIADVKGAYQGGKAAYKYGKGFNKKARTVFTLIGGAVYGGICSWKAHNDDKVEDGGLISGSHLTVSGETRPDGASTTVKTETSMQTLLYTVMEDGNINTEAFNNSNATTIKKLNLDNEVLASVNLTNEQLNIGKLHNILLAAFEGTISIENAYRIESNDNDVNTVINSNEMSELWNKIGSSDETRYFNTYDPLPDKVMSLFNEIFSSTASDYNTVVQLINRYAAEIDKTTELTEEQKSMVKNGLATALYSFNYWNN